MYPNNWTNVSGKTCPGPKRIVQFNESIITWMENGDEVPKIAKPEWMPHSVVDDLLKWKVLTVQPTLETEDMWRMLVFLHRAVTHCLKNGGSLELGPFTATITPV